MMKKKKKKTERERERERKGAQGCHIVEVFSLHETDLED
jgi:hypothetical protein